MSFSYRKKSLLQTHARFPSPCLQSLVSYCQGNKTDWDVIYPIFTLSKHFKAVTYHTCLWKEYLIRTVLLSLHLHPHPLPDPPTYHSNHLLRKQKFLEINKIEEVQPAGLDSGTAEVLGKHPCSCRWMKGHSRNLSCPFRTTKPRTGAKQRAAARTDARSRDSEMQTRYTKKGKFCWHMVRPHLPDWPKIIFTFKNPQH